MAMCIRGVGSALPAKQVKNSDLAAIVDTSDEWIRERTGIESRYVSTGESVADLATDAARKAITDAGVQAENIDLILVASCSAEMALPCTACQIQGRIGAVNAAAFDLNAACSGFLFALNTAYVYLKGGIYKNALIIGAEVLSKIVDWSDRSTCVLFGDGAGAVYVEADDTKDTPYFFVQKSDGAKGMVLACGQRHNGNAFFEGEALSNYVSMDGREVFRFATRQIPLVIEDVLDQAALLPDDIDYFVLHQANLRIIESIAKRLKADPEKFPTNVERVGNTSSASIPILLEEMKQAGKLKKGTKLVLSGFGAGLTYGACLLEL